MISNTEKDVVVVVPNTSTSNDEYDTVIVSTPTPTTESKQQQNSVQTTDTSVGSGIVVCTSDTDETSSDYHSGTGGNNSHSKTKRKTNRNSKKNNSSTPNNNNKCNTSTPTHQYYGQFNEEEEEDDNEDDDPNDVFDVSLVYNFMMEHRIFLRAGLNLLTERDRYAPELGMMDPIVLKSGPLKKASHLMNGAWKVKYVEIRRGMFSYYENIINVSSTTPQGNNNNSNSNNNNTNNNSSSNAKDFASFGGLGGGGGEGGGGSGNGGGELLRKNIPLEASTVICRPVRLHQKALALTPTGAIFELSMFNTANGTTMKRLWMANSREERSVWIHAINNAMVGGSVTRSNGDIDQHGGGGHVRNINTRSPYKNDLRAYIKAQTAIRNSRTKLDYLNAIKDHLMNRSLQIPVKWIAKQQQDAAGGGGSNEHHDGGGGTSGGGGGGTGGGAVAGGGRGGTEGAAFREETVAFSIDQLWKDLQRDTVVIDNVTYSGDALHGPERILGALTKRLLTVAGEQGKITTSTPTSPNGEQQQSNTKSIISPLSSSRNVDDLRESQALVYARDILLAGNRTRSAGDSYYCVSTLCHNPDLVVVVPGGTEVLPVRFDVSEDNSDEAFQSRLIDKSCWIKTRSHGQRRGPWTKLFFVLSEGTLSYYAGALPRPHGLRGQRFITEKVSISITQKQKSSSRSKLQQLHQQHHHAQQPNRTTGGGDGNVESPEHNYSTSQHQPFGENSIANSNAQQFILKISSDDSAKDRLLLFESEDKLLDWVYALECVIKSSASTSHSNKQKQGSSRLNKSNMSSATTTTDESSGVASQQQHPGAVTSTPAAATNSSTATTNNTNTTAANNQHPPNSMGDILSKAAQATKTHAALLGIDGEALESRLATYARRATSAVCVTVSASTQYNICTVDPTGDVSLDTWASIDARFLQAFRVTGGPNGRILRGEETVRVTITKFCANNDGGNANNTTTNGQQGDNPTPTTTGETTVGHSVSPISMRGRMNRRKFTRGPHVNSTEDLDSSNNNFNYNTDGGAEA